MLKIVSAPNNVLSEKAKEIKNIDKSILLLIDEMKQALNATRDPEGVGLAAPQVGKSLQLFIIKPTRKSKIQIFINPVIQAWKANETFAAKPQVSRLKNFSGDLNATLKARQNPHKSKSIKLEGCLSLPSIWGEVERVNEVEVSYTDERGEKHTKLFKGFPAIIVQHEYDHLQGTLFPKRVLEQKGQLYKSKKNAKGEDIFEEIEI